MSEDGVASATAGWYADPGMADTLRYWDGQGWTEHRSPVTAVSAARATPQVDNTVAWTLGFAPLASILILLILAGSLSYEAASYNAAMATVFLNVVLALWDSGRLRKQGIEINGIWTLLVPGYLILRAKAVPGTTAIPIVWFAAVGVSLLF